MGFQDQNTRFSSWRARSQVTEVRARDLRLLPQEAARLLGRMLDREVDETVAAAWVRMTEGWVTALRLAALPLRHRDWSDDLSVSIEGDSRYVQACLLKASITDRICAPLCEAVCLTGADGSMSLAGLTGEAFIDWLQRKSLFLVPLDTGASGSASTTCSAST